MNETVGSILGRKGRKVWSVAPEAKIYDALALMAAKGVRVGGQVNRNSL